MFKEFRDLVHASNFRRVFVPLSTAFFIYTFGWRVTSPIFSIYVNNVTGNLSLSGLIFSLTTMMGIFLNVPFGIIEDRINMKRVLQIVLLVYSALALLYTVANSFLPLLVVSIGRGVASSFLWLTSWAYVFAYTDEKVKGKEVGFFSSMNDFASALSPVIGGFISTLSFLFPFYAVSLTSFTAFVVISLFLKENPKPQKASFSLQMTTLSKYMRNRRFLKTVFLVIVFYALINVYYSYLSIFLYDEGFTVPLIGVIFTVVLLFAVGLEVPMGNMIDRHGIRKTLPIAAAFTALTAILMLLSNDLYYTLAFVTAFTISYTLIFIALYSRMSDIMGESKVAMTGAIATFKDLGYTIGPLMAGMLMIFINIQSTLFVTGVAFLLLVPVALFLHD
jgi:DHA1 family multidrug resistance protein-like MFS transporter